MQALVRAHIEASIALKKELLEQRLREISSAGLAIAEAYRADKKLLCCGNGGSAGDAQHIATEFLIRYTAKHERPSLAALSLASDSSALTAGANDFGFAKVFSRQIEGLAQPGDVLLAITTSGNSENILLALEAAKAKQMRCILLTGREGGRALGEYAHCVDHSICVPSEDTARIQECHIMIGQIFCAIVERELYKL